MTSRVIDTAPVVGRALKLFLVNVTAFLVAALFTGVAFAEDASVSQPEDGKPAVEDKIQKEIREELALSHFKNGLTALKRGQNEKAMESFELTIKADPSSYNTRLMLAKLYASNKKPYLANKTLREAIQNRPDDPRAYDLLISLLLFRGKSAEAVEVGELALANGVPDKYLLDLGWAYYKAGMFDKAEKRYERELEFRKDIYATYRNLGILYYATGRYDKSLIYYKKAEEAADEPEAIPLLSGVTYAEMGNEPAARNAVNEFKTRVGDGYTKRAIDLLKKLFPHSELPDMKPYIYSYSLDKIQQFREVNQND